MAGFVTTEANIREFLDRQNNYKLLKDDPVFGVSPVL
jgi:hypothetical protein